MKQILVFFMIMWLGVGKTQCPGGNYQITTQTQIDNFSSQYPNCTHLGFVSIVGSGITSLKGLEQITKVEKLKLYQTNLTTLEGLDNLARCVGDLRIEDNVKLADISSLNNLLELRSFKLKNNTVFDGDLPLQNISSLFFIWIQNNPALSKIAGVEHVKELSQYLVVDRNPLLETLDGFEQLKTCRRLTVLENESLSLLDFPQLESIEFLRIEQNEKLVDLSGLNGLTSVLKQVSITDNKELSACYFLCDLVDEFTDVDLKGNRSGCNSFSTIACSGLVTGNIFYDKNRNQIRDDNETGVPNIMVSRNNTDNLVLTLEDGGFGFEGIVGASYDIAPKINKKKWTLTTSKENYQFVINQGNEEYHDLDFGVVLNNEIHDLQLMLVQASANDGTIIIKNSGPYSERVAVKFHHDSDLKFLFSSILFDNYDTLTNLIEWDSLELDPFETKVIDLTYSGFFSSSAGKSYSNSARLLRKVDASWEEVADVRLLQEFPVGPAFNVIGLGVSPVGETDSHLIPSDTILTYSVWYNGWDDESVLKQELDADLDLASFEFVYSSEPVELRFEDGTLSFYKEKNVLFSYFNIEKLLFQIRPKPDLPEGTRLDSKVIMIDSSGPEKVDSCFNIIKSILRPWVVSDEDLLIGPNPTGDFFRVQSSAIYEDVSDAQLLVYDYLGRVVRAYDFSSNKRYYLEGLVAGAYVVVLQSASEPSMHQVGKLFVQ